MICLPKPFAIAIDDMGWINGENDGNLGQGPFRLGVKRKMDLTDYAAVVDLAKRVGVRLQGLFILGELDKENIASHIPTITPKKENWKNSESDLQNNIIEFVKNNVAHLEFGLHGVGHEYWPDDSGDFKRAEWYNLEDNMPWPERSIRDHLDCFVKIMAQYDLTFSSGNIFPESFVPCAYSYYWNPNPTKEEYSLGSILFEYGVRYANTDFNYIPECDPPIDGGFDQGVHVMNRANYGNIWHMIGQTPSIPIQYQKTFFIETHWPNLLAQDAFLQNEVTVKWMNYFHMVSEQYDRYCSKNTAQHHSQFLYVKYTTIYQLTEGVEIDNSRMPTSKEYQLILGNLVLKIPIEEGVHVKSIELDGGCVPAYVESGKFAYLYLPKLKSKKYLLKYKLGHALPEDIVWHDSTCNILDMKIEENSLTVDGRFYGAQTIRVLTKRVVKSVHSNNIKLKVNDWSNAFDGVQIDFSTSDLQGVSGSLILGF